MPDAGRELEGRDGGRSLETGPDEVADAAVDGTTGAAASTLPVPSMASLRLPVWDVRVEIGQQVSDSDVRDGLSGYLPHQLDELDPHVGTGPEGRAELELTVPGRDVWTSALSAMAVLQGFGYDLQALHVRSRPAGETAALPIAPA